jgi:hypothetical protein
MVPNIFWSAKRRKGLLMEALSDRSLDPDGCVVQQRLTLSLREISAIVMMG